MTRFPKTSLAWRRLKFAWADYWAAGQGCILLPAHASRVRVADLLEGYLYWRGDRACALLLADWVLEEIAAQGIEARQGGDGATRLHRNDESPVAESDAPNGGSMTITTVELLARLRRWEGDGHPHGLLHRESATLISNLVKALEPFAKIANHCEGEPDDTVLYTHQGLMGDYPLTIGDFRNAAKALRSNLDKEEGDNG